MGSTDDFGASVEWSAGGLLHAHIAFWMVGAPCLDKIIVPKEKGDNIIEVQVEDDDDSETKPTQEAASLLASAWHRVHTEFNVAKAMNIAPACAQEYENMFELCEDTGVGHKIG